MPRARALIAAILVISVAMGVWATLAIRRTAGRRVTLVEALTMRLPKTTGARELSPWKPVADADLAHISLCFDDSDPAQAVAKFAEALGATSWRVGEVRNQTTPSRATITASDGVYRLRGVADPGSRINCDGARRQTMLSIEAAPNSRTPPGSPR